MAFMLAVAMGCGNGQEAERTNAVLSEENKVDEGTEPQSQSGEEENSIPAGDISERENDSLVNLNPDNEMMCIGGKVRSIAQDSFIISRTL